MNKKILFLSIFCLLIILGVFLWFVFGKKEKPKETGLEILLKDRKIFFPEISSDNQSIFYYDRNSDNFMQFSLIDKKIKAVSKEGISWPEEVKWSPDQTKVLFKITNLPSAKTENPFYIPERPLEAINWFLYSFESRKQTLLPENIIEIVWTADGQKIVYQYLDKEKGINTLNIADPDGKNWHKIIDLENGKIFLETLKTGEILYTSKEETDNFSVIKTDGTGKRKISLPILVNINKIVWSLDGKSLFAAIREEKKTTDTFYKIDLETAQKQEIKYQSQTKTEAQDLMLTKDGKTLYFTSENYLFKLEINF